MSRNGEVPPHRPSHATGLTERGTRIVLGDIDAIKSKYDPQNLFHHNANIQPT
jgi:hypothetical protein